MGQVISDLVKESDGEAKEQLEILQEMARSIMDAQSERMAVSVYGLKTHPVAAIADRKKCCYLSATSGVDSQASEVVDSLFDGKFMKGFKKVVTVALDKFISNARAGRQEKTKSYLAFDNNVWLRIDLYMYMYEFSSESLRHYYRNLFCYVAQVAILDNFKISRMNALSRMKKRRTPDSVQQEYLEDCEFVNTFMSSLKRLKQTQL